MLINKAFCKFLFWKYICFLKRRKYLWLVYCQFITRASWYRLTPVSWCLTNCWVIFKDRISIVTCECSSGMNRIPLVIWCISVKTHTTIWQMKKWTYSWKNIRLIQCGCSQMCKIYLIFAKVFIMSVANATKLLIGWQSLLSACK